MTDRIDKGASAYCKRLEVLLVVLLAAMAVMVFGNVVLRYAFNSGITESEELSRWAFIWMTFLGAIVAIREGGHLGSDMLVGRLGPTGKKICLGIAQTLMLYSCWLILSGSLDQTRINLGLIACAGIIAPIIPPSIAFVIFGVAANVSITKLFLAGIFPGLLMAVSIAIAWYIVAKKENVKPPAKATSAERLRALRESTRALVLPLIVLVGLKFGVFTPTEAAVVVAVYALFVSTAVYRELKLAQPYHVFVGAAKTTAVVLFLVAAVMVSAWLITVAALPQELIELLQPFLDRPMLLMFIIMILVMVVGTAMDMTPRILILTPVLMPLDEITPP